MKIKAYILSFGLMLSAANIWAGPASKIFDFYGDTIEVPGDLTQVVDIDGKLSYASINAFYQKLETEHYQPVVEELAAYRTKNKPDDWLFYQLIRKTTQQISPKSENYVRYTLYKWFLLNKLGYDAILSTDGDKILMYVRSDDNIYDIPFRMKGDVKYVCLNYHDYGFNIDFSNGRFEVVDVPVAGEKVSFSYKLTQMPKFDERNYREEHIRFSYADATYHFKVKVNDEVKHLFANYPVTDYQQYFGVPMSSETHNSLIPQLKEDLKGKSVKNGVSFLMHFTRYSFEYRPDGQNFGKEKRLSPEQTLLYSGSDCEDRVALFFYLVKEIYNLPMIVLTYPDHVSIAVAFDKPVGTPIMYNGKAYSICEPTPQRKDMPVGKISKEMSQVPFEVAYAYSPR